MTKYRINKDIKMIASIISIKITTYLLVRDLESCNFFKLMEPLLESFLLWTPSPDKTSIWHKRNTSKNQINFNILLR